MDEEKTILDAVMKREANWLVYIIRDCCWTPSTETFNGQKDSGEKIQRIQGKWKVQGES